MHTVVQLYVQETRFFKSILDLLFFQLVRLSDVIILYNRGSVLSRWGERGVKEKTV